MKAFALSSVALVVIAAIAGYGLSQLGWTSADVYTTSNVRL